jgi:hypothetical protein
MDIFALHATLTGRWLYFCRSWGSHCGGYEVYHLLKYCITPCSLLATRFLVELIFCTPKMEAKCSAETSVHTQRLHCIISQKIVPFDFIFGPPLVLKTKSIGSFQISLYALSLISLITHVIAAFVNMIAYVFLKLHDVRSTERDSDLPPISTNTKLSL